MTRTLVIGTLSLPRLGVVAALLALTVGCGGSSMTTSSSSVPGAGGAGSSTVLRAATLRPGQPVPLPEGKPVLTLTGEVAAKNQGSAIALGREGLDQLGLVQVRVYEPWVKENLDFRGVWLQDLLDVAGATADASRIRITALDDYQVDLTMAEVRAGGIFLATKAGDGSQIPIDKGGPTRIVFLDGVKAGANAEQWIWSLKTIDVR